MPAGRTYTPILTTTLNNTATTINFTSIPSGFTDLIFILSGRVNTQTAFDLQFNSDTGTNYSRTFMEGNGSTVSSSRQSNHANLGCGYITTSESISIIHIMNYSNTSMFKTILARGSSGTDKTIATVGLWRSTSAISSVSFGGGTFQLGLTATLYGIMAA